MTTIIATMRRHFTLYVCPICDRELVVNAWQETYQERVSGIPVAPQCPYCTTGDGS